MKRTICLSLRAPATFIGGAAAQVSYVIHSLNLPDPIFTSADGIQVRVSADSVTVYCARARS